jgi:hypothetical protein
MVLIASDNQDVVRSIQRNLTLLTEAGATFSANSVIKCIDGPLSIEAPPDSAGTMLIRLPLDCLLPIEFFQLSVADDNIIISSHEPALASECVQLMEALLELYNVTCKLAWHRRTSPWSLLASHPELLMHVAQRLPNDLLAMFEKFIASGNNDQLMLDSFLHTRAYDYRDNEKAPPLPVLVPGIDFLNHHLQGAPVQLMDQPDNPSVIISRSIPVPGAGNECFACYGLYDSFDTWMSYGFIDNSASFVRSVPMTIDLPQVGTIRVANFTKIRDQKDLPQSVVDLHLFIPQLLARKGKYIEVAALLLPGPQAPDALRRTLSFLTNELSPAPAQRRDLVMQAEDQIITANRTYYVNLLAPLQALTLRDPLQGPIRDNFVRMCDLQLAHIEKYAGYARG